MERYKHLNLAISVYVFYMEAFPENTPEEYSESIEKILKIYAGVNTSVDTESNCWEIREEIQKWFTEEHHNLLLRLKK